MRFINNLSSEAHVQSKNTKEHNKYRFLVNTIGYTDLYNLYYPSDDQL